VKPIPVATVAVTTETDVPEVLGIIPIPIPGEFILVCDYTA
jgi:hypothetical protein